MRFQELGFQTWIAWLLVPLTSCGFSSNQANYKGAIAFDGGVKEPMSVQVFNNNLGTGKTDNQIVVELTVDQNLLSPGDTFRRVILSGSNADCTAKDYIRGKLESDRSGACDFPNGWFEETVNGKKTGKTIKIEFDPTVRNGELERLNAALRSP